MPEFNEQKIIASWHKNARPWITAVRKDEIESRVMVTNQAILDAIMCRAPAALLDIGCGEGWLVRSLAERGIDALGIDAIPELIESASRDTSGRFQVLAYEDICADALQKKFDVAVCNFSLLGKESVEYVFQQAPSLLNPGGAFIVQTLHPVIACGDLPYRDGWRQGSWAGFSDAFTEPPPWYFRTMESWQALFVDNGFKQADIVEPLHPDTRQPSSIIFTGGLRA